MIRTRSAFEIRSQDPTSRSASDPHTRSAQDPYIPQKEIRVKIRGQDPHYIHILYSLLYQGRSAWEIRIKIRIQIRIQFRQSAKKKLTVDPHKIRMNDLGKIRIRDPQSRSDVKIRIRSAYKIPTGSTHRGNLQISELFLFYHFLVELVARVKIQTILRTVPKFGGSTPKTFEVTMYVK